MIAAQLRQMKEDKHMTVQQIADKSGVPASTVSRVLSGQTDNPGFQVVSDIVLAMGGSVDEIIGIAALKSSKSNVTELYQLYERTLAEKNRTIKGLTIACIALVSVLILILLLDVSLGTSGFIRY